MNLKIDFSNGGSSVDFKTSTDFPLPIELVVPNGGKNSRDRALMAYIQTIDYAFRGVINRVTGDIVNLIIQSNWFGRVAKIADGVVWDTFMDKSYVVIYDISSRSLMEKLYVADKIAVDSKNNVTPLWLDSNMNATPDDIRNNLLVAITKFSQYIDKYDLQWGFSGEKLSLLKSGKEINMEHIQEDDIYMLLKFINIIVPRGTHMGVLFIDCNGFSDNVLRALIEIAKETFGYNLIFLYNCGKSIEVERELLVLPNFIIKENLVSK